MPKQPARIFRRDGRTGRPAGIQRRRHRRSSCQSWPKAGAAGTRRGRTGRVRLTTGPPDGLGPGRAIQGKPRPPASCRLRGRQGGRAQGRKVLVAPGKAAGRARLQTTATAWAARTEPRRCCTGSWDLVARGKCRPARDWGRRRTGGVGRRHQPGWAEGSWELLGTVGGPRTVPPGSTVARRPAARLRRQRDRDSRRAGQL